MNSEIYIHNIISSLKIKLNENNEIYRTDYKGNVILSEVKFNKPLTDLKLQEDRNITIPKDYIEFLKISNGAELFKDDYPGSKCILELYSLEKVIKEKEFYLTKLNTHNYYPIGMLLDNCELIINQEALKKQKDYLELSDGTKKFKYGFREWIDKFIIAQGNEFWLLENPSIEV